MKLGIIMPPKPESFDKAKEFGLDFLEFDCNPTDFFGVPTAELLAVQDELKAASERTGVEVGAVGRWASHILDEDSEVVPAEWEDVKHVIDFGAHLGAKYYLCSVNYAKGISYYKNITAAIQVLKDIVAYAKDHGMETAIVNCMMGDNYIRTPEQWKLVLDEVPGLGIKYDPSHSFVHGGQNGVYIEEGMEWGAHFTYCHVKGVIQRGDSHEAEHWAVRDFITKHPELKEELMSKAFGNPDYDNPPAGIDVINWRAFFAILYMHGYDGYLAIEPHSATWRGGEKADRGVKYTIKYIRDLMILD